jgi:hypothetical protein
LLDGNLVSLKKPDSMTKHLNLQEMKAKLPTILDSPKDQGSIEMLVIRPKQNHRELVSAIKLSKESGPEGDIWKIKPSSSTPDGSPHPEKQLTIMNSRCIDVLAQKKENWALAGDQIFADLDLSLHNMPAGTRLKLGTAVVEVSAHPHTGCKKFVERFGVDALRFVSSPIGKEKNLRGINAFVVEDGLVGINDVICKLS